MPKEWPFGIKIRGEIASNAFYYIIIIFKRIFLRHFHLIHSIQFFQQVSIIYSFIEFNFMPHDNVNPYQIFLFCILSIIFASKVCEVCEESISILYILLSLYCHFIEWFIFSNIFRTFVNTLLNGNGHCLMFG